MALEQDTSSRSENLYKRVTHLLHCRESPILFKTGQEKLYPPTHISASLVELSPNF